MKDRIEHTEHKARRNGDSAPESRSFGERRYGATAAEDIDREAGDRLNVRP